MLVLNYPKDHKKTKLRKPLIPLELSITEQLEFVDTVMFIPVDTNLQIHVAIYKKLIDNKLIVDMRNYRYINSKWIPTSNGVQLPVFLLDQLVLRLNHLNRKYNK